MISGINYNWDLFYYYSSTFIPVSNCIHYKVWDEITYPFPKHQQCNRWGVGMDKYFHYKLYQACDYLSMLGLKLNYVSKRGPGSTVVVHMNRDC